MKKYAAVFAIALVVATMCGAVAAQIPATRPRSPNITPLGPQAHRPPGDRPAMTGAIFGFVYWDATLTSHLPSPVCSALSITVAAASKSNYGPFGSMGTQSHFTPMATAHPPLTSVNTTSYDGCAYEYDNAALGQNLYVKLNLTQPLGTLTPATVMKNPAVGPIQFSNAPCSTLPPLTKATVANLLGNWGSCQNVAYDVNLPLVIRQSLTILSSNGGTGGNQSGRPGALVQTNPGPINTPVLTNPGPQQRPMLSQRGSSGTLLNNQSSSSSPSRGMLLPAVTPAPAQTPSQPGIAPGASAQNVQMNPPTSSPRLSASRRPQKGALQVRQHATVALSAPKQGQRIVNPKAALQNAGIIAVLQQQSHAALAEASQMKLSIRPAGFQGQPSKTMAATGNGMLSSSPTVQRTNAIPSGPASGATGRYGKLQPVMNSGVALQCGQDPTMRVLTVSGGPHPAVFTQDSANNNNFYTLTGCSFGNMGPNVKAYIYYQGTFHVDFQIQQWTDNWIAINVDPNLTGVDDQNSVVLVIQRNDGTQATKTGNKFYAARQTVPLSNIRQAYFSLNHFRPDQSTIQTWQPTYTSGSSAAVRPNLSGLTAEVHWDITPDPNGSIVGGSDMYDLSHLHPTFVLQDAWMEWRDVSCDSNWQMATSSTNWAINWYGPSGIKADWQGQVCQPPSGGCGGGFLVQGDCFISNPESNYGIDVTVTGPRGIDPWTGKPGP